MKSSLYVAPLLLFALVPVSWLSSAAVAESGIQQSAESTKDIGAAPPVQATAPAASQGHTTLIGCLSGPDTTGKFMLRSMLHRTGVEVIGPDDLKKDSGAKVKLTGSWKPGDKPAVKGSESRTFAATQVDVLALKCEAPTEKTPISKEKQQKQQQKQNANAPPAGDTSPK